MKDRIKIVHAGYGGSGGVARVMTDIARNHGNEIEPSIIYLGYEIDNNYLNECKAHGIEAYAITKDRRFSLRFLREFRKIIRELKPDVVFLHSPVAYHWGRIPGVIDQSRTSIVSVEHLASSGYGYFSSFLNYVMSVRSRKIVCVSSGVYQHFKENKYPEKKLVIIRNGIRVQKLARNKVMGSQGTIMTMVARLSYPKDHHTLLKGFALLTQKRADLRLRIAGEGPLKNELMKLAETLGIIKSVEFTGHRDDIRGILLETDIFVLSTRKEGMPISILEAMEAGCVVVATDIPTVNEVVVNDVTGKLVPMNDEYALAETLDMLIREPERSRLLSKNARDYIDKECRIEKTAQEYERLASSLINS